MARPEVLWTGREQLLSLKELERSYMRYVIDRVGGRQTRAAALLGISRKSLWERRRRLGLP